MTASNVAFQKRLRRLARQHKALSQGYETRIRGDGLLIVTPKRRTPRVPATAIATFLALFFLLKAVLVAQIGAADYAERVYLLQVGTLIERLGAVVMGIDPVTAFIADIIAPLLPGQDAGA